MVDDKEIAGWDLNCPVKPKIEAADSDGGWLLTDGSRGGVSSGDGTSAEGLRIYKRRKLRKMSNSDEMTKTETGFDDKTKAVDGSAFNQCVQRLSFGAYSNGPVECALRKCSNTVVQKTPQSLNGHEGCIQNALVTYSESDPTHVIKESLDNVERIDNQTRNSAQESSHVLSNGLLKQSEGSTNSELCGRALSGTLNSEKYSEFRGLLFKNFGVVDVNRVTNVEAINSKLKSGAYETSPMLYLKDFQQVWTRLQEFGYEMVTLSKCLSDETMARYEQFFRKPEACGCKGCGEKADVKNCLVCDSCEAIYHLSCTELIGTPIPPKSWYCANCVSDGIGSPHNSCIVCEKLKSAASILLVNRVPTNYQSQDVPNGLDEHLHNNVTDERQSQAEYICFICKSEVKIDEKFRTCGHSLCGHKFYHDKCLTSKQLGVYGPCWYCPSCLCRRCFVDKDDDQIVLCDGCDQAYHIYCTSPQLNSIPEGKWFCGKCDRDLKKIKKMKRVYESMQKKVKIEDESEKDEHEAPLDEHEGLDMLVTAAKTLSGNMR